MFGTTDLAELADRCGKAAADDVGFVSDDGLCEAVGELARARAGLDAVEGHVLAELEARGVCDREFGLTTASWVTQLTRVPRAVAAARVRTATKLRASFGSVDEALGEGRISFDHARAVADAANPRIIEVLADRQDELIDHATRAPYAAWRSDLAVLAELLDQDGGFDPERELARNRLSLSLLSADHVMVSGELVGETALVISQALEREADRLRRQFQADVEVGVCDTIPRRPVLLALAWASLCRQGLATDPTTSQAPTPDITVVLHTHDPAAACDPPAGPNDAGLAPELGAFELGSYALRSYALRTLSGERLDPDRYAHLACDPALHALLIDSLGVPLDLGRTVRLATPGQRRALAIRDRGCVFPGCDARPSWCDAHHIIEWDPHGRTDLANLALLCRRHHGITHRRGWTMHTNGHGTFTWTTPTGRTLHNQHRGPPD